MAEHYCIFAMQTDLMPVLSSIEIPRKRWRKDKFYRNFLNKHFPQVKTVPLAICTGEKSLESTARKLSEKYKMLYARPTKTKPKHNHNSNNPSSMNKLEKACVIGFATFLIGTPLIKGIYDTLNSTKIDNYIINSQRTKIECPANPLRIIGQTIWTDENKDSEFDHKYRRQQGARYSGTVTIEREFTDEDRELTKSLTSK
nr:hypothetical protein [Nanoarchaeota archaeon]